MFPTKARIRSTEEKVKQAQRSATRARDILRTSMRAAVVSPVGLSAGLFAGFFAGRSIATGKSTEPLWNRWSRFFRMFLLAVPLISTKEATT